MSLCEAAGDLSFLFLFLLCCIAFPSVDRTALVLPCVILLFILRLSLDDDLNRQRMSVAGLEMSLCDPFRLSFLFLFLLCCRAFPSVDRTALVLLCVILLFIIKLSLEDDLNRQRMSAADPAAANAAAADAAAEEDELQRQSEALIQRMRNQWRWEAEDR